MTLLHPTAALAGTTATAAATAILSACGGGRSAVNVPATSPATITADQAARFLHQAAFAATDAQIARVQALGYAGWLDEQFAAPRTLGHWDWMVERGYQDAANIDNFNGVDNTLWRKFISSPDVLRQRMVLALSEIFVISMAGIPVSWRGFITAAYVDLLEERAFGTYRQLLDGVTLSAGMGVYLNMRGNQKADLATGRQPDENYAREVLQLFSLGLVELNPDGTPKGGQAQETYGPQTITELARVFTGWDFDGFTRADPAWTKRPMAHIALRYDTGAKSVLGNAIPAATPGPTALRMALDAIAGHPNVAPFISRQLIQRFVTSAPSAAYVGRVAAVFNDNGQGVRGDLKAVLKAILLDDDARRAPTSTEMTRGRLSEPVVRFIQWARTFGLASPTGLWNIGNLSDPATRLGQSPLRAPSVFNFFRPGYVPPNSELGRRSLTAPEFQITNESTTVGWVNFAQTFVATGVGETRPDYAAELALADNVPALVQRVALLLAADRFSSASLQSISQAVATISATTEAGRRNRVQAAVLLVLAAPDYLVQV
jgi:uncharacterized protein (DUF1800 family)